LVAKAMGDSSATPRPLTALSIASLAHDIAFLKYGSRVGDWVVFDDGSIEKEGSHRILSTLQDLTKKLVTFGLCRNEISHLQELCTAFETKYSKGYYRKLDEPDHTSLLDAINRIEALMEETLRERDFSETMPIVGLLNYKRILAQGPGALFGDAETLEALPKIVIMDITDAIRCVAYGIPTPSVMISLRATEGMLREVYATFFKKQTDSPWSEISDELFKKLKDGGVETAGIEGYLSHIRNVRNSAQHPDKRFSPTEAEDLLINSKYAIVELLKLTKHAKLEDIEKLLYVYKE